MFEKSISITFRLGLFLAISLTMLAGNPLTGQEESYDVIPIAQDYLIPELPDGVSREKRKEIQSEISSKRTRIKRDRTSTVNGIVGKSQLNRATAGNFMKLYVFANMTQTDDETLSQLGKLRAEFLDDYLSEKVTGGNREFVINTTIPAMKFLVEGNYHPSVRLNAILIVGMINQVEPTKTQGPRPSAAAINYLLTAMNDPALPDYIKIGAMSGLHRNAMFDGKLPANTTFIDDGSKTQIGDIAYAIINNSFAGQDKWKSEPNYWLRRRSVQILGFLKSSGERAAKVIEIMGDENEKPWIRFDAMVAARDMSLDQATSDLAIDTTTDFLAKSLKREAIGLEDSLKELVEINLLYGDEDLLKLGVARKDDKNKRGSSMGAGQEEGGSGNTDKENEKPKIDLPNYHINLVRRRVQAICSSGKEVLLELEKTSVAKSDIAKEAANLLTDLMDDANVGLIDLAKADDEDDDQSAMFGGSEDEAKGPPKAIADQMGEFLTKASNNLMKLTAPGADTESVEAAPFNN